MATDKSKITISLQNLENYDKKIKKYSDDKDGNLASLTTKANTSLVSAINELDAFVGTLPTTTTKTNLVDYINEKVGAVEGATSFIGVKESLPATAKSGDICIVGVKEYIYDGTKWQELGDESIYVPKTTTIAGVDLQDNITAQELITALGVSTEFATDEDINKMFSV